MATDKLTDRQTHKLTTITLAHAPRIKYGKYSVLANLAIHVSTADDYKVMCQHPWPYYYKKN